MSLNLTRDQEDPILLATGPVANLSRKHAASSGTVSESSDDLAPPPPLHHSDGGDNSGLFDETRHNLEGIRTKSNDFQAAHQRVPSFQSSVSQYSGQIVDEPLRYAVQQKDILTEDEEQNIRRGLSIVRHGRVASEPQSDDGSISRKSTIKIRDLDRTPKQPRRGSTNFADNELESAYQVLETRNFVADTPTSSYSDEDNNLGRIQPHVVLTTSVEPPVPPRSARRPKSMIIEGKNQGSGSGSGKARRKSHKRASLSVTDGLDELMFTAKKELFTLQSSPGESIDSIKSPGELKPPDFLDPLRIETSHETYMTAESQGSQSGESELHEEAFRQTMEKMGSKKTQLPPRPTQENIRRAREVSQQILLQELLKHPDSLVESPRSFDNSNTIPGSIDHSNTIPGSFDYSTINPGPLDHSNIISNDVVHSNFQTPKSINTTVDQLEVAPPTVAASKHLSKPTTPLPLAQQSSEASFSPISRDDTALKVDEIPDYDDQMTTPTGKISAPKAPQLAFSGRQVSKQVPPPLVIPPADRRRDELDHLTSDPVVYDGEDSVFSQAGSPIISGAGDEDNKSKMGVVGIAAGAAVSAGAAGASAPTGNVEAAGTAPTNAHVSTPTANKWITTEGGDGEDHAREQNDDQPHAASGEDDDGFYDIEEPTVTQQPSRARSVKASTTQHQQQLQLQLQLQPQQLQQQKRKKSGKKSKRRSEARQSLKPFTYQTLISLLESTNGTVIGEELRLLDLPAKEKQLIEKIIDALSRLSADMVLDRERYDVGITRLENALRVLEGFL